MLKNKKMIKEICVKLNTKIEMINDIYKYVDTFSESNSHGFSEEVILGACIYLAGKIDEDFKRVRDIINVIYFVKNKHEKIKEYRENKTKEELTLIKNLIDDSYSDDKNYTLIQTMYNLSIENYYILRDEILKAEQHLLRLINYYFESKSKEIYLMLLNYVDYLEFTKKQVQLAWDLLNTCYEKNLHLELQLRYGKQIQTPQSGWDSLILCSILYLILELNKFYFSNTLRDNYDLIYNLNYTLPKADIILVSQLIFKLM